jgi:hypothetical protein
VKILRWPRGLRWQTMTPTTGPVVRGFSQGTTGKVQSVESPYGLVGFDLTFPAMRGVMARRFRGLVTALHGGANAVRFRVCDPDGPGFAEMNIELSAQERSNGLPWGNDKTWSNGRYWKPALPKVPVTAVSAKGSTLVSLEVSRWGGRLEPGTMFGFVGHYGVYTAKEVQVVGYDATVRVWPPLRKALTTDDRATLRPVIAMRLASPDGGQFSRGGDLMGGASLSLIEMPDEVVDLYAESQWYSYPGTPSPVGGGDTTAPTITTAAAFTQAENAAWSVVLAANEPVTWSKVGGADQAKFTLAGATLSLPAKNFEAPDDANADNAYTVTVRATDGSGNVSTKTITVTISNVAESASAAFILDDDFETDPDAWTNLGVVLRQARLGVINLVGVIVCSRFDTSPCSVRAVLDAYGFTNVPVGWTPRTGNYNPDFSNTPTRDRFGVPSETGSNTAKYTPAATLYRQLLVSYPGVRIATGGFLKPLEELRLSAADGISALNGAALMAAQAPKLFLGVGRKPPFQYANLNAWSGGTEENNTGFDRANVSSFIANYAGELNIYPFPDGVEFGNFHPLIHIRDTNDQWVDPLRYAFVLGITGSGMNSTGTQMVGPLGTSGEREAGDLPPIQAAIDDIKGTPTANVAFSATGVMVISSVNGQSSFSFGGHNRHRYFRLTTAKATLETLWQGDLDALLPPTSVNFWKDSTAFGGSSDSGGVITNNNATAPDGTATADTITGSGWGGGVRLFSTPANRAWTYAHCVKKTTGRTRFPVVGIQFRNGSTVLSEAGAVINTNTGTGYAATGGTAPGYGSVGCTVTVEDGASALPSGYPNRADFWVVKVSFTTPASANTIAIYLQSAAGNSATSYTRDASGGSTSQVYASYQLEPVGSFSGWLPTDGDCTWKVAA